MKRKKEEASEGKVKLNATDSFALLGGASCCEVNCVLSKLLNAKKNVFLVNTFGKSNIFQFLECELASDFFVWGTTA